MGPYPERLYLAAEGALLHRGKRGAALSARQLRKGLGHAFDVSSPASLGNMAHCPFQKTSKTVALMIFVFPAPLLAAQAKALGFPHAGRFARPLHGPKAFGALCRSCCPCGLAAEKKPPSFFFCPESGKIKRNIHFRKGAF